ncbi:T9SS type A sorting domain-containing protein [Taibaiella koreensis]|uniref:T9SS type A sorting domain-containing protein n=1 Tax=Taibaiella koreensis TaxID=1268548 RepID=UPI000E59AB7C|nr:T9SS type A sorting domain-containing protein [Taibaiella koreensis]
MRKLTLSLFLLAGLSVQSVAQLGKGGIPLSIRSAEAIAHKIPVTQAELPDWDAQLSKWNADPSSFSRPFLVSLFTPTDLGFPNSGILYTTEDGTRVWRTTLSIAGAKAIGLYYDNFSLPKGTQLFLTNSNNKQILGAFTESNNSETGMFANEPVQGGTVNIELNIEPGVDLSEIKLHINRAAVYFRGVEYLMPFAANLETIDQFDSQLAGNSSVCNINAVCPLGNGYVPQRDAALHTICVMSVGTGTCSSTMVNTANNAPGSCKQYLLIASHCEFTNGKTDATFAQYIFRFNYQHSTCNPPAGTITNTQQSITGAKFVSRSIVPLSGGQPNAQQIKGDFILLEFTGQNKIPASWNVNLAGWDKSPNTALTATSPKKFIGFHHPAGDVKKVSAGSAIQSYSVGSPDSHWALQLDSGYAAQGSSGSALFNGDGRVIGVASVAAPLQGVPVTCIRTAKNTNDSSTAKIVLYSKFSNVWDYTVDGTATTSKLKPWLDPANSNVNVVNIVKSDCTPLSSNPPTGIAGEENKLAQSVTVFPNPSSNGRINIQVNLAEPSDIQMGLYDISGKRINNYSLSRVRQGAYHIDLSGYPNGIYLLKISDGQQECSKKIMLRK